MSWSDSEIIRQMEEAVAASDRDTPECFKQFAKDNGLNRAQQTAMFNASVEIADVVRKHMSLLRDAEERRDGPLSGAIASGIILGLATCYGTLLSEAGSHQQIVRERFDRAVASAIAACADGSK